ncbi:hypothetical protein Cgig2_001945 [Carnegiea gigantea]|uniref:Uncharacterized protein n=1 Tax=Carnegiea gigantea TaxID=171969 RepID=A0A9Q1QAA3_9CARY|nr:hypothetical protein Cgig2_001945 [Carnegiea gigantea]
MIKEAVGSQWAQASPLKILRWVAVEVAFMAIVAVITILCFHTIQRRTLFVGILCVIFCLGMYASPLTIMGKVIKTKSVTYMPFWLSVGNFTNGVIWTIYAFLPLDPWILVRQLDRTTFVRLNVPLTVGYMIIISQIPNGLGAMSGAAQLILYACYYKKTPMEGEKPTQVQMSSDQDPAKPPPA